MLEECQGTVVLIYDKGYVMSLKCLNTMIVD